MMMTELRVPCLLGVLLLLAQGPGQVAAEHGPSPGPAPVKAPAPAPAPAPTKKEPTPPRTWTNTVGLSGYTEATITSVSCAGSSGSDAEFCFCTAITKMLGIAFDKCTIDSITDTNVAYSLSRRRQLLAGKGGSVDLTYTLVDTGGPKILRQISDAVFADALTAGGFNSLTGLGGRTEDGVTKTFGFGFGDPHYECPSGEKFDFEGVEGKQYSLIKDAGLDIDITFTSGDAAINTATARRLMGSSAEEQNSVYTYMNSAKIATSTASLALATNLPNSDNAFMLVDINSGETCVVADGQCDKMFSTFDGLTFSVADTGPCKFHRPGRKLLPKGEKAAIRDRTTDGNCQELTVTSDAFSAAFKFVPAGEMNGSAGVNYLDFSLNRMSAPTVAIDGIIGQCYNSEFAARYAAFPDFLKTKFCDTCNSFEL